MHKTLYELGSLWLLSIQSYVKPTTFSKYACILSNHLAPVFGNIEINRIQEQEIYAFTHQKLSNLSSKTVYDILSVFKNDCSVFRKARRSYRYTLRRYCCKIFRTQNTHFNKR